MPQLEQQRLRQNAEPALIKQHFLPPISSRILSVTAANIPPMDGLHVHKFNFSLAGKFLDSRLCLVADAMQSLAAKETQFDLYGEIIHLKDEKLTNKSDTLAGAHLAMDQAVRNMNNLPMFR